LQRVRIPIAQPLDDLMHEAVVIAETRVRAKHNQPFYALKALWKLAQGWSNATTLGNRSIK
jgi:hypothetical protein